MENEKIKIHTEGTPNPNALKFVLSKVIIESGSYNFTSKEQGKGSPLVEKLFDIKNVEEVFIGKDFITISKSPDAKWESIYDLAFDVIKNHLETDAPVVLAKDFKKETKTIRSEVEQKIHEILDNQIRPAVASDGGDVIFESYKDGVLRLHLQGSCSHCPSSIMTLKSGIEAMLKREIPELKEVISV